MKPSNFPQANHILTGNGYEPLPVYQRADGVWVSMWFPSEEEKEAIAKGEPVLLYVHGRGHPPVTLGVDGNVS